jgi:hypothetical protein
MYECNYMNVWLSVYGGGGREGTGTGTGEAYLGLSFQVGSFVQEHLHHFQMTITSGVVKSSLTPLSETDTHSERERHLAMDDTTHHSQTHMQRDMAYTDTQTCNSGLYSASLHVSIHNTYLYR